MYAYIWQYQNEKTNTLYGLWQDGFVTHHEHVKAIFAVFDFLPLNHVQLFSFLVHMLRVRLGLPPYPSTCFSVILTTLLGV